MPVTITHSTPADGTFSATGAAAWDATHTVSGLGTMAEQDANNVNITGGSISGVTGVATSGANSNITSLSGLTTPLSVAQGGSGTATPSLVAGTNISISGSWPNQTIATSGVLTGLTVNSTPTSGGAAGQIMFDTGSVLQESSNLVWDNTNKVFTLNTGRISQAAGTLADLTSAYSLTATMPAITTATTTAVNFNLTGAGSSAQQQIAFGVNFLAGYTGTSPTAGLSVNNANAGTSTSYAGGGSTVGYRPLGNRGGVYVSNGASAGLNTGVVGHAASSTTANYGVWGGATFGVLNSWNVGVAGFGLNTTTVTQQIGGFFALYDGSTAAPNLATAALVADNGSQSAPVFLARVNGATTWRINTVGDAAWGSAGDAIISRKGAANLRLGAADAAAPVAQTLSVQSVVAGTSNTAGANLTITGSQGTGTGAGGSIIFQVAPAGTTGTAQNALSTALTLAPSASGGGIITHAAGTLADGTSAYLLTATMPTTQFNNNNAINYTFTTAGNSSLYSTTGMVINLNPGYTGSVFTAGLSVFNSVAGTSTTYAAANTTRSYRVAGNNGGAYVSFASTTGINSGITGQALNSTTANYGVWGSATWAVNNAWNVGVAGFGLNTGTGTQQVGGFFALYDAAAAPNLISGALVADNGTTSSPVFLARVNNATAFIVNSTGSALVVGSGGLGYGTGSGGAVTQGTSRTTGVTLNKTNGAITLFSAAGTTAWQSFTVTNSTVVATDTIIVNQKSGTDLYQIFVTNVGAGSFQITFATTGGTTTEQPVFNFAVIKAVAA